MQYEWRDYDFKAMGFIEVWLDDESVKETGLDGRMAEFLRLLAK